MPSIEYQERTPAATILPLAWIAMSATAAPVEPQKPISVYCRPPTPNDQSSEPSERWRASTN